MNQRKRTKGRPKHQMKTIVPVKAKEDVWVKSKIKEKVVSDTSEAGNNIMVKKRVGSKRRKLWLKGQIMKIKSRIVNINVNRS